jgi:hypothetical protein
VLTLHEPLRRALLPCSNLSIPADRDQPGLLHCAGADAFFPVFLFVVIRSRLPHLASNAEYVRRFRSRARLAGQFDYMLCNLVRVWCCLGEGWGVQGDGARLANILG